MVRNRGTVVQGVKGYYNGVPCTNGGLAARILCVWRSRGGDGGVVKPSAALLLGGVSDRPLAPNPITGGIRLVTIRY